MFSPTLLLPSVGGTPSTDPYFSNVSLLLPMTGANNSTTFTDYSPSPQTVTAVASAKIVTSIADPWGNTMGVGYFSFADTGLADSLTIPSGSFTAYGTGDFTIEMWVRSAASQTGYMIDHGVNGGALILYPDRAAYYNPTTGAGSVLYTTGFGAIADVTWVHIAASRVSGVTRLFKNGSLISSDTDGQNYLSAILTVAAYGGSANFYTGAISNLRLTKGVGRYVSSFTAPTAPFSLS